MRENWEILKKYEFNQFYYSGDCAPSVSKQVPVTILSMCQIISLSSFVILLQVHFLRKAMSLSIIIHTEINFFWRQSVAGTNLHLWCGNLKKFYKLEILNALATSFLSFIHFAAGKKENSQFFYEVLYSCIYFVKLFWS